MLTQMVKSEAQRQPAGIRVLQLLFVLLHDGLDDGGGHVAITRSYCDHTACQSCHSNHLRD